MIAIVATRIAADMSLASLRTTKPSMRCRLMAGCALLGATLLLPQIVVAAPTPAAAASAASGGVASAAVPRFEVDEYRVDGNTVLSEDEIDRAVMDYLGPDRTASDVEAARAALEAAYEKKGYPTVSAEIPRQRMENGVVVIKVVERTVGRLRVKGSRYYALAPIEQGAPSVAEGKVLNMHDVQHDIVALNQLPGRSITPVLKAGVAPDTVDVDLNVQDQFPLHGTLELNNRRSVDTTPLRLLASLDYDNLWQRGDSATISFQVAPENTTDAQVGSGSYLFRIPDSPLSLLASYVHSDSNVTTVGSTNVVGKGDIAGLRLLVPLGIGDGFIHSLSVGADYKDIQEQEEIGETASSAPVRYFPLTATYQASWSGATSQVNLVSSLVINPRGLGSNAVAFDNKRFDANQNFIYVRASLDWTQTLPRDFQLYENAMVQMSPDPLISSEQFSLGGLDTLRGYLESEALGDYGGVLQSELRTPSLDSVVGQPLNDLRGFAFFDVGAAAIRDPLPEQQQAYTMYSTGIGVRMQMFGYLNTELIGAFPLADGPTTKAGSSQFLFRIYGAF